MASLVTQVDRVLQDWSRQVGASTKQTKFEFSCSELGITHGVYDFLKTLADVSHSTESRETVGLEGNIVTIGTSRSLGSGVLTNYFTDFLALQVDYGTGWSYDGREYTKPLYAGVQDVAQPFGHGQLQFMASYIGSRMDDGVVLDFPDGNFRTVRIPFDKRELFEQYVGIACKTD